MGSLNSEVDAAEAYDEKCRDIGLLDRLNFPNSGILEEQNKVLWRFRCLDELEYLQRVKNGTSGSPKSSKYRGVTKNKHGKWVAMTSVKNKAVYLGSFDKEVDAAIAYDEKCRELNRMDSLNFPKVCCCFVS